METHIVFYGTEVMMVLKKIELAAFLKRYAIDDSISINTKEAMEAYARYARASGIVNINFVLNFSQFFNRGFVL